MIQSIQGVMYLCKYCTVLYKGLEYLWILISAEDPGTHPPVEMEEQLYFNTLSLSRMFFK